MATYRYGEHAPNIHESTYVADSATVIGRVTLSRDSSVWSQAVLRGDNEPILVGQGSNVQEGAVLHNDPGFPLVIGEGVTVGHQAMLHGCHIGDGSLIGIQAIVMNGAVIGRGCLVAAGAVVTEGKQFPDNSLILGAPAKAVRKLSEDEVVNLRDNANDYIERGQLHKELLERLT
ncbi:gamma carbonic anhydrase family protein [Paraburkholderia kirstenboschensis]|uniref:Gamma carbonic anhydrase family protein n=1 Tax=Paraburkholderia kirstenboschensis TaxID=1245436 RepID=A0ABZ0EAZ1_9BURK|nr:gamma carbonic anhydrase family protein [Paraburkholderia kirstenboschensis]WOD14374.1 gamma carbonic anhydrase family protein [Paraburkholderia kirstenboschensis]